MAQTWRTVRIFIASTFRNMPADQDYLVHFVFPQRRERCTKRCLSLTVGFLFCRTCSIGVRVIVFSSDPGR
jgi:hypothetical protein